MHKSVLASENSTTTSHFPLQRGSEATMESMMTQNPHVVCMPYPAQGHIIPMLQLAKLLHFRGFHITFVNTEFNHRRLLKSQGPDFAEGLDDFKFETIPDGLPTIDQDRTQDIPALCESISKNCHPPFLSLLKKIGNTPSVPPITCIISDGAMGFTVRAAEELGLRQYAFYTSSACGLTGYLHYSELVERGYIPLKDVSCLTNGYLDTHIDWIAGLKDITLRDLPSFIRTTNPDDIMLNYDMENSKNAGKVKGIILNTFEDLESDVLDAIRSKFSFQIFTIGPLLLLNHQITKSPSQLTRLNLWKEDAGCTEWLDTKGPKSVVYVNFGSITVMTVQEMREFAWGLANSKHPFLWIIRPDLVSGDSAILPEDFVEETKGRCLMVGWCAQEEVLEHPSIGGFLTHCGWNSMLESISSGVPMTCWPFFAEQKMNCRFACSKWGIGMEINKDAKRDEVEGLVRELMEGERGKEMRNKAMEWKKSSENATKSSGTSYVNMEKLAHEILHHGNSRRKTMLDNY